MTSYLWLAPACKSVSTAFAQQFTKQKREKKKCNVSYDSSPDEEYNTQSFRITDYRERANSFQDLDKRQRPENPVLHNSRASSIGGSLESEPEPCASSSYS